MPGMHGDALARQTRELRPRIKVVYKSGHIREGSKDSTTEALSLSPNHLPAASSAAPSTKRSKYDRPSTEAGRHSARATLKPVAAPATYRFLLETPDLQVGEFYCRPPHPLWHEVNDIGNRPHLVFPRTSVYIERRRGEPVLATPNHVLFYGRHERYRRALHDPRGDYCVFVTFGPAVWEKLTGARPPAPHGASDADTYLLQHLLVRHLREEGGSDRLFVEEGLYRLAARALAEARATAPMRLATRAPTRRRHRELAEAAKDELSRRVVEAISLHELAGSLHASPFHLSRVFHEVTGYTLHDYRIHLRLRHSLEHLEAGADLTRLAYELGFCSLAHFSGSFRRVFGMPPSSVRGCPDEMRKIVEARARGRFLALIAVWVAGGAAAEACKGGQMRRMSVIALLGALLLVTQAAGATGQFVEPTRVLYTIQGSTPPNGCATACFGWAGSELGDVDRDGAGEIITSEPFTTNGSTYVYSGRKGGLLYRFDGAVAGASHGYAIADAGDTNGDRVPDILTTAPTDGAGHVYVYSGRTGRLLYDLTGANPGEFFGSAVASAGDVDRDHRADILVGAEMNADAALPGWQGLHLLRPHRQADPRASGRRPRRPLRVGGRLDQGRTTATTCPTTSSAPGAAAWSGPATARARCTSSPAAPASSFSRSARRRAGSTSATSSSPGLGM